jgi:hypothetical protein
VPNQHPQDPDLSGDHLHLPGRGLEEHVDAAVGEADQGGVVALAVAAFPVVVGAAVWILRLAPAQSDPLPLAGNSMQPDAGDLSAQAGGQFLIAFFTGGA